MVSMWWCAKAVVLCTAEGRVAKVMLMTQVEKDQRNKALPPLGRRDLALALEWVEALWLHM